MVLDQMGTQERKTAVYDCLSRPRRRYALYRLEEVDDPLSLPDLAEDVAEWEAETSRSELSDERVKDVYMSLYHNHVPRLEDAGLVEYDQEQDAVELVKSPEELLDGGADLVPQ